MRGPLKDAKPSADTPWVERARTVDGGLDAVVAAASDGDPDAFAELIRSFAGPLVGFLRARGADDPEGMADEVLVSLFRAVDRFEGGGSEFRSWMYAVARNRLVDERRARARRISTVPTSPGDLAVPPAPDTVDRIDQQQRVEELLAALSDDQREIVLLRVVAGLDVAEAAAAVGKSEGAVRSTLHRALNRLRQDVALPA